jgi:hypothetical protein
MKSVQKVKELDSYTGGCVNLLVRFLCFQEFPFHLMQEIFIEVLTCLIFNILVQHKTNIFILFAPMTVLDL